MRGYYPGEREYRDRHRRRRRRPRLDQPIQLPRLPQARRRPRAEPRPPRERSKKKAGRRLDWVIGIVLGVLLGIAVVAAFLLFGSEDTIDAPSVSGGAAPAVREAAPSGPARE